MTSALRKLTLTAHVVVSVGWIGAVTAFLALSVAGLTSQNPETVWGAYTSMDLIGRFVIIPMCFAALATGIIDAFVTPVGPVPVLLGRGQIRVDADRDFSATDARDRHSAGS
jgi:hypothetical protein